MPSHNCQKQWANLFPCYLLRRKICRLVGLKQFTAYVEQKKCLSVIRVLLPRGRKLKSFVTVFSQYNEVQYNNLVYSCMSIVGSQFKTHICHMVENLLTSTLDCSGYIREINPYSPHPRSLSYQYTALHCK
jgi:hypothetical protein